MSNTVENSNLEFTDKSYTVAEFKAMCGCNKLHIMPKKEKPGEFFFVCGAKRGYNAGGKQHFENPMVSECCNKESGETFFMLHEAPNLDDRAVEIL